MSINFLSDFSAVTLNDLNAPPSMDSRLLLFLGGGGTSRGGAIPPGTLYGCLASPTIFDCAQKMSSGKIKADDP